MYLFITGGTSTDTCSQEDILAVAGKISSTGVELTDIAACLNVPGSLDETATEVENGTERDEIVKLLLKWQARNQLNSSIANLCLCLQQLKNPSIDEILQEFCGNQLD